MSLVCCPGRKSTCECFTEPSRLEKSPFLISASANVGRRLYWLCRRYVPLILGNYFGLFRIALIGRGHDLHTMLVKNIEDILVFRRVGHAFGLRARAGDRTVTS